jgi:hypothetical protein
MVRERSRQSSSRGLSLRAARRWSLLVMMLLAAVMAPLRLSPPIPVTAAGPACTTSGPGAGTYTARVCLSTSGTTTLIGNVAVTTTVTAASGTPPVIKRVSGKIVKGTISSTLSSVLSDYAAPYTYTLPTARWTDGIYRLYSEVTFSDDFVAVMPVLQVTFANGVTVAPVSNNTWTPFTVGGSTATIAAVGDGAGGLPGASAVGSLVTAWNPAMFLYLGDVYNSGTYTEFLNYYDPTLGALNQGPHESGRR